MFNFKARDFFLAGFILGAIAVALIMLSILFFQSRSTAAEEPEPVPEEPTRVVEKATMAPEEPTVTPTTTRAIIDSPSGLHYALLNPIKPPLDDVSVRQALRYAIDRGMLAEIALEIEPELLNTYATGTLAPGFMQPEGLQDELMRLYDPEEARSMLARADLGDLSLVVAVPPGQTWWFEVYAEMWSPLDIRLDYVEMEEQEAIEAMLAQEVDVYLSPARRLSTDPAVYYPAILNPFYELSAESGQLAEIMDVVDILVREMTENPESREGPITELEFIVIEDMALVIPGFRFGPAERE